MYIAPPEKRPEGSYALNRRDYERLICNCNLLYKSYAQLLHNYRNLLTQYQTAINYNCAALRYVCQCTHQAAPAEDDMPFSQYVCERYGFV